MKSFHSETVSLNLSRLNSASQRRTNMPKGDRGRRRKALSGGSGSPASRSFCSSPFVLARSEGRLWKRPCSSSSESMAHILWTKASQRLRPGRPSAAGVRKLDMAEGISTDVGVGRLGVLQVGVERKEETAGGRRRSAASGALRAGVRKERGNCRWPKAGK